MHLLELKASVRLNKRSSSVNQFMKSHSCEVSSDRGGSI